MYIKKYKNLAKNLVIIFLVVGFAVSLLTNIIGKSELEELESKNKTEQKMQSQRAGENAKVLEYNIYGQDNNLDFSGRKDLRILEESRKMYDGLPTDEYNVLSREGYLKDLRRKIQKYVLAQNISRAYDLLSEQDKTDFFAKQAITKVLAPQGNPELPKVRLGLVNELRSHFEISIRDNFCYDAKFADSIKNDDLEGRKIYEDFEKVLTAKGILVEEGI